LHNAQEQREDLNSGLNTLRLMDLRHHQKHELLPTYDALLDEQQFVQHVGAQPLEFLKAKQMSAKIQDQS
jgi:hypothetical protein